MPPHSVLPAAHSPPGRRLHSEPSAPSCVRYLQQPDHSAPVYSPHHKKYLHRLALKHGLCDDAESDLFLRKKQLAWYWRNLIQNLKLFGKYSHSFLLHFLMTHHQRYLLWLLSLHGPLHLCPILLSFRNRKQVYRNLYRLCWFRALCPAYLQGFPLLCWIHRRLLRRPDAACTVRYTLQYSARAESAGN